MLRAALLTSSKYSSPLLHYCLNNNHSHSLLASGLPHRCFVCSSAATPLNSTPTVIRRTALPTTTGSILMATDSIPNVPASISFPGEEEKILSFWKDIDAFKTSLKLSEGRPPFSFYDGPPFATGLPHYGHLLAGTIKDVVTRFAHLNGHYVERRFGWDTHGLPVEYEIDKKLNIKGPADVAAMGIAKYNAECRAIVMTYANEWEATVTRMGRWIDFENDYKTLNITFMESVWWVFKQLFDKGQVYRGFKIMPYSMAVCTPLSNFEANQNYKDVVDPAIVISFPLTSDPKVSFLAWTTTPWTLPTNLALCVHPDFEYIQIHDEETGADWILLEKRLDILYKDPKKAKFTIVRKYKGSELKGMTYVPLFDYFSDRPGKSFVVLNDTYVTDDSGTGIVHSAPAFGEDDYRICLASGVVTGESDLPCPLDAAGNFTDQVSDYKGMNVKDADKPIQKDLKARGRLIRQTQQSHSYPFCYRSDTPLIYRAVPSWYVRVSNIVDKLIKNNSESHWVPDYVGEKRFHNWLAAAHDWGISRSRYWGTPIPIWMSDDMEEMVAIGSVQELMDLSGVTGITDLHRDKIDHITIPSKMGKGDLKRIPEVFDCWFESGSMPYAQQHYPFENKEKFEASFPADFIAEGIDQTRGWFYTLTVLAAHLFDKPAFKNVIVNGLILAGDGKKMSKRLKNYPDPMDVLNSYGADVLRLYLITSPAVRGESSRFREEGVKDLISKVMLPWYNAYRFFFAQLALLKKEHDFDFAYNPHLDLHKDQNIMDIWILASTQSLIAFVKQEMTAYRLYTVTPRLLKLIDTLTNWYVRFNRKRLKGENGIADAERALNVLFEVLFTLCRLMAAFAPFLTEMMYQNLKLFLPSTKEDTRSVHFLLYPEVKQEYFNEDVERAVGRMQTVIELGRYIREQQTLSLKTPCRELIIINPDLQFHRDILDLKSYIQEELNIRTVTVTSDEEAYGVKYKLIADAKVLGTKFKKDASKIRNALPNLSMEEIKKFMKESTMTIEGFEITSEDVQVARYFDDSNKGFHAHFTNEVLVILDTTLDQELIQEGLARELINRIQRLRKKAGLQPVDDVMYYYELVSDPDNQLASMITSQEKTLLLYLKQSVQSLSLKDTASKVITEEEQEVAGSKFNLVLVEKP